MRKRLSQQEIFELIQSKQETKNLDFKKYFNWKKASNDEKLMIVKHILSMANTKDGGKIIFGVEDRTFKLKGLPKNNYESFDQTEVNNFLQNYTDPKFYCQVYKEEINGKLIVVIDVPEFEELAIICAKDAFSQNKTKHILKKGQIYIRTKKASSEAISSSYEMKELLELACSKRFGISSKEEYEKEIKEADEILNEMIRKEIEKYAYWEIIAHPVNYQEKLIEDIIKTKELIMKSQVKVRGNYFPYLQDISNFNTGIQFYAKQYEGGRIYQSGLFKMFTIMFIDNEINTKNLFNFVYIIHVVTMFFLFFKKIYGDILPKESINLSISLNGCLGRELYHRGIPLFDRGGPYICKIVKIAKEEKLKVSDLQTYYKEKAIAFLKHIFQMFNCEACDEDIIKYQNMIHENKA
ncbi:MAG: ATP-binding protein [Candidatus Aminicenantes bacterium]|nr:ATP-binding protein [Candidatus Aminicenantes bacterium]